MSKLVEYWARFHAPFEGIYPKSQSAESLRGPSRVQERAAQMTLSRNSECKPFPGPKPKGRNVPKALAMSGST